MKTIKKLQVAVAVASLFAVGNAAMAAAISQSGVTVAREVISRSPTSTQSLIAPSVSFNFANGPTANAASTQDFSVSLQLGGDGTPSWSLASLVPANIWKTINARKQANAAIVYDLVGPADAAPAGGGFYLRLLDVQREGTTIVRYYFRLENPTIGAVSLSDLALEFNSVNSSPVTPGLPTTSDYARVTTLQNSINSIVGSTVGTSGTAADACGNTDNRITVQARNFIGSGPTAPEGETSGLTIINNGYILFAQALNIQVAKGIAINRATDPTQSNTRLVASTVTYGALNTPLGTPTQLPLGYVKFSNVPSLSAWDTDIAGNYYAFAAPKVAAPARDGDLGQPVVVQTDGDVDVGSLVLTITSTNGFAAGSTFSLTNNPFGTTGAAGAAGTDSGAFITPANQVLSTDGLTYTLTFTHADLVAASNAGLAQTLLASSGANIAGPNPYIASTDKFYINYIVPGTTQIPLSNFTAVAKLTKQTGADEQDNLSCVGPLAGLGGGVKIDVRNFFPYDPANPGNEWVGVIRVINNDENVSADVTGQYIRADGKYGQWGALGTLAPRASRYYTSKEINDALVNASVSPGAGNVDNTGPGGIAVTPGQALPANTRLRISSNAASTLRVQSYIYNGSTKALVEVSAAQGADFVNVEASQRDHIDQDAQTGIKK